ncbi:hypothetical protein, partial [Stieleria varia]|uniref:hypothetical protein n=1 Tax=Stieleria varia TaxID=2528005 RepID=UPI001E3FC0BB
RSFWADSLAETWGWHPMLYAVAAPQLNRGALASPRPQAMLLTTSWSTWKVERQLFTARPERNSGESHYKVRHGVQSPLGTGHKV